MIDSFRDFYFFLSNFYRQEVTHRAVTYMSAEHAYQAAKTLDPAQQAHVMIAATPGESKRRGQRVTLRDDWDVLRFP